MFDSLIWYNGKGKTTRVSQICLLEDAASKLAQKSLEDGTDSFSIAHTVGSYSDNSGSDCSSCQVTIKDIEEVLSDGTFYIDDYEDYAINNEENNVSWCCCLRIKRYFFLSSDKSAAPTKESSL